jgi:hypothetical protein
MLEGLGKHVFDGLVGTWLSPTKAHSQGVSTQGVAAVDLVPAWIDRVAEQRTYFGHCVHIETRPEKKDLLCGHFFPACNPVKWLNFAWELAGVRVQQQIDVAIADETSSMANTSSMIGGPSSRRHQSAQLE